MQVPPLHVRLVVEAGDRLAGRTTVRSGKIEVDVEGILKHVRFGQVHHRTGPASAGLHAIVEQANHRRLSATWWAKGTRQVCYGWGLRGPRPLTWSAWQVCDDGRAADPRRAARGTKRLEQPRRYGIVDAMRHVFAHKPRRALAAAKGLVNQLTKLDARWPVVSEQHAPAGAKRVKRAMHDVRAIHALLCDELTRAFDDVRVKLGIDAAWGGRVRQLCQAKLCK